MNYIVQQTESFVEWRNSLKDLRAATSVRRRIERAESGNLGDVKPVGCGISEMRVDVGQGYRMYFTLRNRIMVLLLVGGNKSTQQSDIRKAIEIAKEV